MLYTTAYHITRIKLERNENLIKLMNLESKISKLEMIIQYRRVTHNAKYVEILNKINDIERKQMYDYSIAREHEVRELTRQANDMTAEIDDIKNDILPLKNQFMETIMNIRTLNDSIPDNAYIIRDKPDIPEHKKKCIPFKY